MGSSLTFNVFGLLQPSQRTLTLATHQVNERKKLNLSNKKLGLNVSKYHLDHMTELRPLIFRLRLTAWPNLSQLKSFSVRTMLPYDKR